MTGAGKGDRRGTSSRMWVIASSALRQFVPAENTPKGNLAHIWDVSLLSLPLNSIGRVSRASTEAIFLSLPDPDPVGSD